ncbi:hypothetical protein [Microbacterium sp. bgisy189]|uniref:hypothetical protein n=1 Tax=Microbacterium sp. bgisy189 TaxID=3413798 RepID=UPI003EBBCA3A
MTNPTAPRTYPFDARPLTEPVDRATVKAYKKQLIAEGRAPGGSLTGGIVVFIVIGIVFLFMFSSVLFGIFGALATSFSEPGLGATAVIGSIVPVVVMLTIVGGITALVITAMRRSGENWYRFDRFAKANGMTWYPTASNPPLPGMIFSLGSSRQATDILRGSEPRLVEFGNYRYTTGSGKNKTTHKWGYVGVHLSSPLPHIVLDAVGNNGLFGSSNLPAAFDKDQRLSLEGDFDKYFHLYCPQGYERDALYLFTPDIMARFIDNAAALDIEIVDDWLFLYAKRDFSTLDPNMWNWLFSVVGALLDKLAQWERWRDERLAAQAAAQAFPQPQPVHAADGGAQALPFAAPVESFTPPRGVAKQGQRLQRRVRWVPIIAVVGFGLFWILTQSGILTRFLFN